MTHILKLIKEQQERTGFTIHDNIWDFGSCYVKNKDGKIVFEGDRISCQVYINQNDEARFINQVPSNQK